MEKKEIDKLKRLKTELDALPFLDKSERYMDYIEMNKWIMSVINFYHKHGIELNYNSFKDVTDNQKMNAIINEYMRVFFDNLNNLEDDIFRKTIFKFDVNVDNHIMDEIYLAIMNINYKNMNIFNKIFDGFKSQASALGVGEVNISNLFKVREEISNILDEELVMDNMTIKRDYSVNKEKKMHDNLNKLIMIITKGNFKNLSDEQKMNITFHIDEVIDIILKVKVFDMLRSEYIKYSRENKYDSVLKQLLTAEIKINELEDELDVEKAIKSYLEKKNNKYGELKKKEIEILNIEKMLLLYKKAAMKIKNDYLQGFYNKYNVKEVGNQLGINKICDKEKLFGIFDIKNSEIDESIINEFPLFKSNGLHIPVIGSQDFKELSEIALSLAKFRVKQYDDNFTSNKKR